MSFVMSDAHARALGMEDVMKRRLPYPADAGDAGGGGRRDGNPRVGSAPGVRPAQCQEPTWQARDWSLSPRGRLRAPAPPLRVPQNHDSVTRQRIDPETGPYSMG